MRFLATLYILALAACSPATYDATNDDTPAADTQPDGVEASTETPEATASSDRPDLEQLWVTSGFSAPEGVAVEGDILYISNVAGEGGAKDGEGWISRLSLQGEILDEKWISGLNAPKGMAVRDGKLFVSDYDAYHVIDIATAQIENTYPVDGAGFLNDITVWQNGVYLSDSGSARIFQIDVNGYKEWLADDRLGGVNGLTADGERLLIATMDSGSLLETRGARDLTELATGMENADGIAVLDTGGYLVSSWPGQIWHVTPEGETVELHNTEEIPTYQNDLTRVGDMIIVPNWQPGTVTAWRLKTN
ncbi:MAG: SMP-30/gluconolactonase/LRE family protein [Henriciella sp.]